MPAVDLKDATIKILDGTTPTANEITLTIGEGNLTWSEKRNIEYVKDRGVLDTTREGDEEPVDVSLEVVFDNLTSSTGLPITPREALKQLGQASAWVTTGGECEPYAVDIQVDVDVSCGTVEDERITFSEFRFEDIGGDFRAGTLSITGKCNETTPTAIRTVL